MRRWLGGLRRAALRAAAAAVETILRLAAGGAVVRIGQLNAKGKISILISYVEPAVRMLRRDHGRFRLVVINPGPDPNPQLTAMYRRVLDLYDGSTPVRRWLYRRLYALFAAARSPVDISLRSGHTTNFLPAWVGTAPAMSFTAEEEARGRALFAAMGLPGPGRYVCLGLREGSYYRGFDDRDAQEDTFHRNPSLAKYMRMADRVTDAGLHLVRMGTSADVAMDCSRPGRFDYPFSDVKSPFADVWLLANARFTVAGGAGLWWFSAAFNRPTIVTDSYTLWGSMLPDDLFLPRLLWKRDEKRFLTFAEMIDYGMLYIYEGNCARDGVEMVFNSEDEIAEAVDEMIRRLDGTWVPEPGDEDLQARFKRLYPAPPSPHFADLDNYYRYENVSLHGRIGAAFLRRYQDLLPPAGEAA